MKVGWLVGVVCLTTVAASLPGCESPAAPVVTSTVITVMHQGTLDSPGETDTYRFTVGEMGVVNVIVISTFQPATSLAVAVGIAVGTWDGTSCSLLVKNDNATLSTAISGQALPGEYCATVYDVGNVGDNPVNYTLEIRHL
jgi:hypothetical protein